MLAGIGPVSCRHWMFAGYHHLLNRHFLHWQHEAQSHKSKVHVAIIILGGWSEMNQNNRLYCMQSDLDLLWPCNLEIFKTPAYWDWRCQRMKAWKSNKPKVNWVSNVFWKDHDVDWSSLGGLLTWAVCEVSFEYSLISWLVITMNMFNDMFHGEQNIPLARSELL